MSVITNSGEPNCLRTQEVYLLLNIHRFPCEWRIHNPGLNILTSIFGGGALGWMGTKATGFFLGSVNPTTQAVATLASSVIGFIGFFCYEESITNIHHRNREILKDYKPWEIVKDEDLKLVLKNSSKAFQAAVLKINPEMGNEEHDILLNEFIKSLPGEKAKEERINFENVLLSNILADLNNERPYEETYKKCGEVFGKFLSLALEDYLSARINHANVKKIYKFSVEKKLQSLERDSIRYYAGYFPQIELQNSLKSD